ncbi:phage tail protein [Streptosporangium sp. DT93]|uniref:phage tail protein n=1 Tax=Streptosporangium sp. DT93 TaxID=3393428 RepID=UPI003CE6B004
MATLKTLLVRLGMDTKQFKSGVNRALGGLDSLVAGASKLSSLGKGAGLAVMAGQAINLGAALAPAAGALLALPAAMLAVKAASLTAKVGMTGVAEAMAAVGGKDAAAAKEALDKLSPSARAFVTEAAKFSAPLKSIKQAVQEAMFSGLSGQLKPLLGMLPIAKSGMVGIATGLNGMAREAMAAASTPFFSGKLKQIFSGTQGIITTLTGAVRPLLTVVMTLGAAGMPLAQRMAEWATNGAKAAAAFLTSEAGASKLAGIVQRAGDTLASLGRTVKNVAIGLGGLFSGATTGGGNLLTTIEQLSARFAAWAQSAQGQQQIGNVFQMLAQTGAALGPVLGMLSGPLTTIAGLITSMPPGVQDTVSKFLAFSVIAGVLGSKLGPAIAGIRLLATGIGGIPGAVAKIGPAATAVAAFGTRVAAAATATAAAAGRMVVSMATAAAGMVASAATMVATMTATAARVVAGWVLMGAQSLAQAARVAAAWVLAMGPIGWITAAVIALVALIVANWDTIKEAIGSAWEWVQQQTAAVWNSITSTLSGIWNNIKAAAAATWAWIKSKIDAFVSGAIAIFQNFTLPGLIMKHWDSIKAAAAAAWNSLVAQVKTAVANIIAGAELLASLPGKVRAWFAELVKGAIEKAIELVTWIKGLPPKIAAGLGNVGTLLLQAGKDVISGLINGVKAMANQAIDAVKGVVGDAVQGAKNLLGIKSPSTVFLAIGQQTMQGWINGVMSQESLAVTAVRQIMGAARAAASADPFGDNRVGIDKAISAAEKKASQQSVEIKGSAYGTSGVALEGGGGWGSPSGGAGGVTVNMHGTTVHEAADIPKIGAQFGFEYSLRGAV